MTPPDPRGIARLLRQRAELGLPPLVFRETPRETVLEIVRRLGRELPELEDRFAEPSPASSAPAPGAARGRSQEPESRAAEAPPARPSETRAEPRPVPHSPGAAPDPDDAPGVDGLGYDRLRDVALLCRRCGLAETRTQVVFSDGNPEARLVVVGEAPGANEDRTGLPFVGQAGKLLDLMLASIGLSREDSVYICNVLKCRPPGNRNPQPHEIRACSPFLRRQLELVRPEALLAVGTFAAQLLTSEDAPLGQLRGTVHSYQGIPLVATYHPAALLRNSGWVRAAWDDLQLLRQVMD